MPDDRGYPSWVPTWVPDLFPGSTPFRDPPPCPPGTRRLVGGGCSTPTEPAPPPKLVEIDEGFVAPVLIPRPNTRPPKVPGPVGPPPAPPAPAPGAPGGGSVVDRTTGRYFPRGPAAPRTLPGALSVGGALLWVWAMAFGPSLGFGWRERSLFDPLPRNAGPPRRTRPRGTVVSPNAPRPFWDETYRPGYRSLPDWLRPARGPFPTSRRIPTNVATPLPRTVPTRPRTLPGGRSTVQPLPAPAPWGLGDPLPSPGYDPFTYAPAPAPAPRAPPRPAPRTRDPIRWPLGLPFGLPGSVPAPSPRTRSPLTPQPTPSSPSQPTPRAPPLPRLPPAPTLTPFDQPVPRSQPQPQRKPTEANPCTEQRTERRRRQKDCKRYTTKTIRVCADK